MSWLRTFQKIEYGVKYNMAVGYINEIRPNNVIRVLVGSMEFNELYNVYVPKKYYVLAHYANDERIKTGAIVLVKRKPKEETVYSQRFYLNGLLDDYNSEIEGRILTKTKKPLEKLSESSINCNILFPKTPEWLNTKIVDIRPEFYKNNQVNYFLLKIIEESSDEISHNYKPPTIEIDQKNSIIEHSNAVRESKDLF